MIVKAKRVGQAQRLVAYLFGPGTNNEHHRPHVIAASEPERMAVMDPRTLARVMDAGWKAVGLESRQRPVYHVSVATARVNAELGLPADRPLTDRQFAAVVDDMVGRLGLTDCRWFALRHDLPGGGKEHMHLVVTLADANGPVRPTWPDYPRLRESCRHFERLYGLRQTAERAVRPRHRMTYQQLRGTRWRTPTVHVVTRRLMRVAVHSRDAAQLRRLLAHLEGLARAVERLRQEQECARQVEATQRAALARVRVTSASLPDDPASQQRPQSQQREMTL